MKQKKARIKYVQGGTVVELYSDQHKKWYQHSDVIPKADALKVCMSEGYEVISIR